MLITRGKVLPMSVRVCLDERKMGEERKWERKKNGMKERKENREENIIPYVAWMKEGNWEERKKNGVESERKMLSQNLPI